MGSMRSLLLRCRCQRARRLTQSLIDCTVSLLSRHPADSLFGHQLPHTAARYAAQASAVQAGVAAGPDAALIPPAVAVCVRELGGHPRLAPIVARIHEEAAALATILDAAAAHLQRLDDEAEEREAQAAVDAAGPSPIDTALDEAVAAMAAEEGRDSGANPADPVAAAAASTRSLRALCLSVAGVMAARRAAAELAGDDGQRAHFDGLYRQLVADAANAHDLRARERDKADEEMMRRLANGSVGGLRTLAASLTRSRWLRCRFQPWPRI